MLAVVAGFVLGAESWDQLGRWGRVGLLAVLQEGRSDDALADPSLGVAAGALVLAAVLYALERRVLQQLALFLAVVATMVAGGHRLGWSWETVEGYGFLVLGAAWLELGRRGLVGPRRTSEVLGSLALLSGPAVLDVEAFGPGEWGLWLGLGLSVGLIVAGSALARNVLLGIGAAGGNGMPRGRLDQRSCIRRRMQRQAIRAAGGRCAPPTAATQVLKPGSRPVF